MTVGSSTLFWITSRAAGTAAMVLASASVGFGLTLRSKLVRRGAPDRRTVHEILALCTIAAIAVHGLALLGDSYFHFTLANISIPLLAPYRNLYTSVGIIAGWGFAILGLSYYARRRIGQARWRTLHRFTAVAWLLALVHAVTVGTDAGKLWFLALVGLTAAPGAGLLIARHLGPSHPAPGSMRAASG